MMITTVMKSVISKLRVVLFERVFYVGVVKSESLNQLPRLLIRTSGTTTRFNDVSFSQSRKLHTIQCRKGTNQITRVACTRNRSYGGSSVDILLGGGLRG